MGKGDARRPQIIDSKTFEENWNRIFKNERATDPSDNRKDGE